MKNLTIDINSTFYTNLRIAGISFRRLLLRSRLAPQDGLADLPANFAAKLCIVAAVAIILLGYWARLDTIDQVILQISSYHWGFAYILACQIFLGINAAAFLWRVILVIKYKPAKVCTDKQLPTCTVIVPAYNEGYLVLETLRSIIRSDYPADKLQIIAIDDGSGDDTWEWMETAADEFAGRIETIRFPKNRGKKSALFEGFLRSRGDVVVTIDSDSTVEKQALRRLVSPFVRDKSIGAVAGSVRVLNRNEGSIARMLDVSFAFSFDFFRASQSEVNTVFCTPGALSAYRRKPLMKIANQWKNQTFFGTPAEIGEDRALTNWLLRTGQHITFQSDAVVYTKVPVRYKGLCKMFLRWARSNVRESLVMNSFIFTKFRKTSALGARINFLLSVLNLVVPQVLLICLLGFILWHPDTFISQLLLGSIVAASASGIFYALRHRSSDALWAFAYSIFWTVALSWIIPYSIITARNGKWLTRQAVQPRPAGKTIRFDRSPVAA